ncbi:MAG: 1-acyl-sn-glycerol-3-phosphate acyltransferase [Spirochaetaceae bacterium]|jgi:1-acyl-sn-glycerol-3-phosphate acyltransferase|nr:1-acyl-sn-glycerol-3-phosphate acyltransferase [Spirochaetaceae bacterium]
MVVKSLFNRAGHVLIDNVHFHLMVWRFLWIFVTPLLRLIFRYRCVSVAAQKAASAQFAGYRKETPAIVISNHTTDLDPFFVGCSFPGHLYFVASEHVLRMGFVSRLIRFFFSPVVFPKAGTDTRALRDILTRLQQGRSICLFAEGNRSFSGETGKVDESTGKLVRLSGAALITYRLRGGYFAAPRWSRKMRKGPVWGEPVGFYPPEVLKSMKSVEITALIRRDISEDAYETMRKNPRPYRGRGLAEDLETALYLCPRCGGMGTLVSRDDILRCRCGLAVRYDEFGVLRNVFRNRKPGDLPGHGIEPFATVRDWWLWQYKTMEQIVAFAGTGPICSDDGECLFAVEAGSKAHVFEQGRLSLGREGLRCGERLFPLEDIPEIAITGQRTLAFTAGGKRYELKNKKPRSAAKYQRVFELLVNSKASAYKTRELPHGFFICQHQVMGDRDTDGYDCGYPAGSERTQA